MHLILILFFFIISNLVNGDEKNVTSENTSDVVSLPDGQIFNGDYFAKGESVEISGTVNGDAYIFATQVVIDGKVNGDVLIAAANVEISGDITNNIRIICGQAILSGSVGHNVSVIAGNVQFANSGKILGNIVCAAGNIDLAASIQGDANIIASNLRVSNRIQRNLNAYVGQMRVTSKAQIGNDLEYRSSSIAYIDPNAKIGGKIVHYATLVHHLFQGKWLQGLVWGSKIAAFLMNFIYTFAIGIVMIRIFPKNLESALEVLYRKPWKAFGYGVVLMILLPFASLVLLMTILGTPFALTLLALNVIGFYTAKVFSVIWASHYLFTKLKMKVKHTTCLSIGLILYFLLTAIPVFGFLLALAAMLFGLGAGVLAQQRKKVFS